MQTPSLLSQSDQPLRPAGLNGIRPSTSEKKAANRAARMVATACSVICGIVGLSGLGCSPEVQFQANELEWYKQEKLAAFQDGKSFDEIHRHDVADIMTSWFGTPNQPFFPLVEGDQDPASELVSGAHLKLSAGPVSADRLHRTQGLYREHCAHCHGISGDGAGPTAPFLDPYPRDFRHSKFKFKSSPTGTPPSKADLKLILLNGIPGSAMPSFRLLDDHELDSLVDYVIYLSVRGTTERLLIGGVRELGEDQPRFVSLPPATRISELKEDPQAAEQAPNSVVTNASPDPKATPAADDAPAADPSGFDPAVLLDELDYLSEDYLAPVTGKWLDALEFADQTPTPPAWVLDESSAAYAENLALGQALYLGQANCKQCHGDTGVGDGQLNNFDDWTNDWLKVEGINPSDPQAYQVYMAAGALAPRPILPRNLRSGVYRGGSRAEDIFRRIRYGIEGTPMPASLTLSDDQVWALVAYVQHLPFAAISRPKSSDQPNNLKSIR